MDKENKITVISKNLFYNELPDITVSFENGGTLYSFNGVYDGNRALSEKLLKLMDNDKNIAKGGDKQNDI